MKKKKRKHSLSRALLATRVGKSSYTECRMSNVLRKRFYWGENPTLLNEHYKIIKNLKNPQKFFNITKKSDASTMNSIGYSINTYRRRGREFSHLNNIRMCKQMNRILYHRIIAWKILAKSVFKKEIMIFTPTHYITRPLYSTYPLFSRRRVNVRGITFKFLALQKHNTVPPTFIYLCVG